MIFYGMRNKSIVMKKKIDCNPQISKVNQWKRQEMLIISYSKNTKINQKEIKR